MSAIHLVVKDLRGDTFRAMSSLLINRVLSFKLIFVSLIKISFNGYFSTVTTSGSSFNENSSNLFYILLDIKAVTPLIFAFIGKAFNRLKTVFFRRETPRLKAYST
jgi:hypothetical protein